MKECYELSIKVLQPFLKNENSKKEKENGRLILPSYEK